MHRSAALPLALALALVLAGCAAPVADPGAAPDETWTWPDDPPTDRLGWEAGVWYNESIAVDQSDGLNETEREVYVARTMARVEVLRELEFTESVPIEVVSRAAYRNRTGGSGGGETNPRDEQTWEAPLLVGEDRTVPEVFAELYGENVLGFYSPSDERIVIVSDAATPGMPRGTLAHELVHALQDQHFGLPAGRPTRDGALARAGLVEGDARYVERLYGERCGSGEWDCVADPPGDGAGGGGPVDRGVLISVLQPYSDGPTLVHRVRKRGGWAAVDDMYGRLPESSEQVIHPRRYPDERPVNVTVPDRSDDAWAPAGDPNTLGEATLFVSLWANGMVPEDSIRRETGAYSSYNYSHPRSDGWAGDSLVAYRGPDGAEGYVWVLEFDTPADADAFAGYYEVTLELRHRAEEEDPDRNVLVVPRGPFADAFRITREGTRVTVVNAPTVEDLDRVHAA